MLILIMANQVSGLKAKKISALTEYNFNEDGLSNIDSSISLILADSSKNTNYKLSFKNLIEELKSYILKLINSRDIKAKEDNISYKNYIDVNVNTDDYGVQDYELSLKISKYEKTGNSAVMTNGLVDGIALNNVLLDINKANSELGVKISNLNENTLVEIDKIHNDIYDVNVEIDEIKDAIYDVEVTNDEKNFIEVIKTTDKANKIIDHRIKLDVSKDTDPINSDDGLISKKQVYEMMNNGKLKWDNIH